MGKGQKWEQGDELGGLCRKVSQLRNDGHLKQDGDSEKWREVDSFEGYEEVKIDMTAWSTGFEWWEDGVKETFQGN